jgi:hypothetical protein
MPVTYCELELRIEWRDRGRYLLTARFNDPTKDLESDLIEPVELAIDVEALRFNQVDSDEYGAQLTTMLFGPAQSPNPVRRALKQARDTVASSQHEGLRIRLAIQASAPELHALRWEALRDPEDGSALLISQQVWFSRFLSSLDFRFRPAPERGQLQALIVVPDPVDQHEKWGVVPIDRQAEIARVEEAFSKAPVDSGFAVRRTILSEPATVFNIVRKLREESADILFVVCHGLLTSEGDSRLLLEDDERKGKSVDGKELVQRLRDMSERPRVVILVSCDSAGSQTGGVLAAIGPRLIAAGVPAVLAMQGKISVESASKFMPAFLREFSRTGQVDQAVAFARGSISDRSDWWMPVLFMRLKTGRIWQSRPSVGSDFEKWTAVALDISGGNCVPVLGPGLVEGMFGSTRDIARQWAERYEFPLAPRDRDDLAQVAQYLAYRQSKFLAIEELRKELVRQIRASYPDELRQISAETDFDWMNKPVAAGKLDDLISKLGKVRRSKDEKDPHRLLSTLPFKVFINANRDNLLRDALIEQGKEPEVSLCTWIMQNGVSQHLGPSLPEGYVPSIEKPLIFQVFGSLAFPESLVLTEDDYFDFLIAVTRNETLSRLSVPTSVTAALAHSGMLLLGFQPDDWDFRVLLRGILKQPGAYAAMFRTRVAVQLSPIEGRILHPDRAIRYIQKYFSRHFAQQGDIETFWASPQEFIATLEEHCRAAAGGA